MSYDASSRTIGTNQPKIIFVSDVLTGVKKDSATKRALAFSCLRLVLLSLSSRLQTYEELHFRDLLVNLLHELDDKVDQFVLEHLLGMEIRNEERDVVTLPDINTRDQLQGLAAIL